MKKKMEWVKKGIYEKLTKLPIRMVLTISLFPFFLLLLICCVFFYGSGTRQYTELVKKNAKAVVEQSRNSLNQDLMEIQDYANGLVSQRAFYTMKNNVKEGNPPIEPVDYLQMTSSFTAFLQHYPAYIDTIGLYLTDNSIYYIQSNTGTDQDIMRNLNYEKLKEYVNDWMWVTVSDVLPQSISKSLPYNLALIYPLGSEISSVKGCLWIGLRNDIYLNAIANSKVTINSEMNLFRKNGTIILDEPEIHLHPEWQLKFAEIIVLIQKEFNTNILLNTHSPYFLNAIEVYSQKYELSNKCKFYLADENDGVTFVTDVTADTEKIYAKLAKPLQELENIEYGNARL